MNSIMEKYPKTIKALKSVGVHHVWRLFLKGYQLKWVPTYVNLIGPKQYYDIVSKQKSRKKLIKILHVKGYRHPIYLRPNTSDFATFKQIFVQDEYNVKIPFEPKTIIDAGANCGYSAVYFANRFPNATIIAIEPEKTNCDMIRKNTQNFNNVHVLEGGVWSKTSDLVITNKDGRHWSFQVDEVPKGKGEFKGYSLDDIMKMYKLKSIDILKMDIEGSEKPVFEKNYKNWLSKTKYGFLELHERYAKGVTKIVQDRIKEFNFRKSQAGEKLTFFK